MMYTVSNSAVDMVNNQIFANSMDEAYLKALLTYKLDAVGCNIVGENGDCRFNVCRKAWIDMLAELCPAASLVDVFNFELAGIYYRLGKLTKNEARAKSRLWRWMDNTGFRW